MEKYKQGREMYLKRFNKEVQEWENQSNKKRSSQQSHNSKGNKNSQSLNDAIHNEGFPQRLKLIKEQLGDDHHPLRRILDEFIKCFIYINRHLLYSDVVKQTPMVSDHDDSMTEYDDLPNVSIPLAENRFSKSVKHIDDES